MNIQELLFSLEKVDKTLITDKNCALSGSELVSKVTDYSEIFYKHGIRKGVSLLLNMSNDTDSIISLLAAWKNGAVVFVGNPFSPINKIKQSIDNFELQAFIGSHVLVRTLAQNTIISGQSSENVTKLDRQSILKNINAHSEKSATFDSCSIAIFSSGSTGEPKAILNSFENIYENALSHAEAIGLREDDVIGCALPLYYSYGLVANLLSGLIVKASISLTNLNTSFNEQWFDANKVSVVALTPYFAKDKVIKSPSLRVMTLGGDALTIESASTIRNNHPNCELYSTYGLTEAGPRVATWRFDNCELPNTKLAPLGEPLSCCRFRLTKTDIWSDTQNGTSRGELVINTSTRMKGYYKNGECSLPTEWHEDEVHTGDIFEEIDGNHYFVTRDKDMIVQNGEKIFPANVESILISIDGVIDARLIGSHDKVKGEIAEAYIQATKETDIKYIQQKLLALLPRSSMPSKFHLVKKINRTATGKKANKESFKEIGLIA